jgi:hypothetical protein
MDARNAQMKILLVQATVRLVLISVSYLTMKNGHAFLVALKPFMNLEYFVMMYN